jgi:hypothetical protein
MTELRPRSVDENCMSRTKPNLTQSHRSKYYTYYGT